MHCRSPVRPPRCRRSRPTCARPRRGRMTRSPGGSGRWSPGADRACQRSQSSWRVRGAARRSDGRRTPLRAPQERRLVGPADDRARRAARREGASRRQRGRDRAASRRSAAAADDARRSRGCSPPARTCTGGAASRSRSATGASSATRPAYSTTARSHSSRTTPRSWVMSSSAMPRSRTSDRSRSRICAWTVTSSAVVGSSAMSSSRLAGERHGDHHPLAHATRQLVGVALATSRPDRADPPREQLVHPSARGRRDRPSGSEAPPRPARRRGRAGSSAVSGSWKIIATCSPRTRRYSASGRPDELPAGEADAALDRLVRRGSSPMIARLVTLLPDPDSPTRPTISPGADRQVQAVDRVHRPGHGAERDRQAAHLQQCPDPSPG